MSEIDQNSNGAEQLESTESGAIDDLGNDDVQRLTGMYQEWFLDYASYVILERAVPHVNDGLKPVQRRIMHSMKRMDDGRYNKVANIIGHTMQFHPHGDASIGDALVQLGQKEFLVDAQGNWGNIYTGDGAAAPRYIEARLSKFALDVLFSPKVTQWKQSYDGRNKEPQTLPVKFPMLLAQGVEGIAVGLASKILPHNFNELIDASIAYLRDKPFEIFPDFMTGGMIDVSRYNDGLRGGAVKVRARINKQDAKTLVISDIPYGKNTTSLIDSILKANEKGKIKVKKIDDNTAGEVEILVHLAPGTSSDKTIDALYAFTDCEVSISPNACVIEDNKPRFIGVSQILKINTDNTVKVLRDELYVRKDELESQWHTLSLEKIFIEERIYKDKGYEDAKNKDEAVVHIRTRLEPFLPQLRRPILEDDILHLFEIKMGRILKFNADKAQDRLLAIEEELAQVADNITHIIPFTIDWFKNLKKKYGAQYERKTELRSFETIVASKVVVANQKLYINRSEGFIGTGLKKDEFVCECSDIDDVIIFYKDGTYLTTKVTEKQFISKNPVIHIAKYKRNDKRTTYNLIYRDGRTGPSYMKRFFATGMTRDKEYNMMQDAAGSKIWYFTANPNGEAEVVLVKLKPKPRMRSTILDVDFGALSIKGRSSKGNLVTKNEVFKVSLKHRGVSTLGGRKIYFDWDVLRLNSDKRGDFLGEFQGDDKILVVADGSYYTTGFDLANHFDSTAKRIEKFDSEKVWSAVFYDADQKHYYLKRFNMETVQKPFSFIGDNEKSDLVLLSSEVYPQIEITFKGADKMREPLKVDVEDFIAIKGVKARGKRLTTYKVASIVEIEPMRQIEVPEDEDYDVEEAEIVDTEGEEQALDAKAEDSSEEILVEEVPKKKKIAKKAAKPKVKKPSTKKKADQSEKPEVVSDAKPREYLFDDINAKEPPKKSKKAVKKSKYDDEGQMKLFD